MKSQSRIFVIGYKFEFYFVIAVMSLEKHFGITSGVVM